MGDVDSAEAPRGIGIQADFAGEGLPRQCAQTTGRQLTLMVRALPGLAERRIRSASLPHHADRCQNHGVARDHRSHIIVEVVGAAPKATCALQANLLNDFA